MKTWNQNLLRFNKKNLSVFGGNMENQLSEFPPSLQLIIFST